MERRLGLFAGIAVAAWYPSTTAAHWCDTLWDSSYNLIVRPEVSTLHIPSNGSAECKIVLQNNMGYPLCDHEVWAEASGYNVELDLESTMSHDCFLPAERLTYTMKVSGSNGDFGVTNATFYVHFGGMGAYGRQDRYYGGDRNGKGAFLVKLPDGSMFPSASDADPGSNYQYQSKHLNLAVGADYSDLDSYLKKLMKEYCVGRGSWVAWQTPTTYCSSSTSYDGCATISSNSSPKKFDWQHLWAGGEVAIRHKYLSEAQLAVFRKRLMCGFKDPKNGFAAFTALILGHVSVDDNGADPDVVAFLTGEAGGDGFHAKAAKAALYLMGDKQYRDELVGDLQGDGYAAMLSATVLAMADGDDGAMKDVVFPMVTWTNPERSGLGMTSSHMVHLAAWAQRGYKPNSDEEGAVSFFGEEVAMVPPVAPTSVSCAASGDNLQVTWNEASTDEEGNPVSVERYRVYWGTEANTCPDACQRPGEGSFDYAHSGVAAGTSFQPTDLAAGETYYIVVAAETSRGLSSVYSDEVSCVAPEIAQDPVATIACTPTSGLPPLDVHCDGDASVCPNCTITRSEFIVAGEAAIESSSHTFPFSEPASYTITLRVMSDRGRWAEDSITIVVNAPTGENQPPVPVVSVTPLSGMAPLDVTFDASGSSDPDNDSLTYVWEFDGSTTDTSATATHTFETPGVYYAVVTITDDGSPSRRGTAMVVITVLANDNTPPNIAGATVFPTYGNAPLDVDFDGSSVVDPDGGSVTVTWELDDGVLVTEKSGTYVYDRPGKYELMLIAYDDDTPTGASSKTFAIEVVGEDGAVKVSGTPSFGCASARPILWLLWFVALVLFVAPPRSKHWL